MRQFFVHKGRANLRIIGILAASPDLYPLNDNSTHTPFQLRQPKMSPDIDKCSWEAKFPLGWEPMEKRIAGLFLGSRFCFVRRKEQEHKAYMGADFSNAVTSPRSKSKQTKKHPVNVQALTVSINSSVLLREPVYRWVERREVITFIFIFEI